MKVDSQFTPQTRLSSRVNGYNQFVPLSGAGGATTHPSARPSGGATRRRSWDQFTQVLANNKVNEIKARLLPVQLGHHEPGVLSGAVRLRLPWLRYPVVSDHTMPDGSVLGGGASATLGGSPRIQFARLQHRHADEPAADDRAEDVADSRRLHVLVRRRRSSRRAAGRRVPEAQLPLRLVQHLQRQPRRPRAARHGVRPQAQLAAMFPDRFDWSTWNYNALSPHLGPLPPVGRQLPSPERPARVWRPGSRTTGASRQRLTLNLGIRWDADLGVDGREEEAAALDVGRAAAPARLGARRASASPIRLERSHGASAADTATTTRSSRTTRAHQSNLNIQTIIPEVAYDGRADFADEPVGRRVPDVRSRRRRVSARPR